MSSEHPERDTPRAAGIGRYAGSQPWRFIGSITISLLIIAPAASPAVALWATNSGEVPKFYRLVLVAGGFALLGVGVFWVLRRLFSDSRVAGIATFFILLVVTAGGRVMEEQSWALRWFVAIAVMLLAVGIVHRLRGMWLLDAVVVASAVALLVPPMVSGIWASVSAVDQVSQAPGSASMAAMAERPDVVIVIVDGYTSLPVLRELYGFEDRSFGDDLAQAGFEVVEPILSPYPMTHLTISSLLEMDYLAETTSMTEKEDGRTLSEVMGGESYLVELLAHSGYRITMVESGWHMATCGAQIDICVSSQFIDEGVGLVLSQSLFWSFLEPSVGSGFTQGALHSMSWTTENLATLVNDDHSDLIFIHVLAPHPPLFLDSDCDVSFDQRMGGMGLEVLGADPEMHQARLDGYVRQVQCVNGFLRGLADSVAGSDSLVFVAGDHGSDSMSQLLTNPRQWTDAHVLERMSVFLAVKSTPECLDQSSKVTVGFFRSLVSCAGDLGLDPIDDRSYLLSLENGEPANMMTLDSDEVGKFARCLDSLTETLECS